MLTFFTITFSPQRIFEWNLLYWKVNILGFNFNTNFAYFGFILSELWPFEAGPTQQSKLGFFWDACTHMHMHTAFQNFITSVFRAQSPSHFFFLVFITCLGLIESSFHKFSIRVSRITCFTCFNCWFDN